MTQILLQWTLAAAIIASVAGGVAGAAVDQIDSTFATITQTLEMRR